MDEDMNGFRIWTAADNGADLHSKGRFSGGAKAASALMLGTGLLLSMIGCGKKTPAYAGPPDTVRQIIMKKWEIDPARVEVPQGARVELVVTSIAVSYTHLFPRSKTLCFPLPGSPHSKQRRLTPCAPGTLSLIHI